MVTVKPVELKGCSALGVQTNQANGAPLAVMILAPRGVLVCANFDLNALDSKGVAAVMVKGINSIETALETSVVGVTRKARELGVETGMPVREALERLC